MLLTLGVGSARVGARVKWKVMTVVQTVHITDIVKLMNINDVFRMKN